MKNIKYYQYKKLNKEQLIEFIKKNQINIDTEKYTDRKTASGIKHDIFEALNNKAIKNIKKKEAKIDYLIQTDEGTFYLIRAKNQQLAESYYKKTYHHAGDIWDIQQVEPEEI